MMKSSITSGLMESGVEQKPLFGPLLHIWLHPRMTLTNLAAGGAWSWIAPIGLALLVLYMRLFALAYLHDDHLYGTLMSGAAAVLVGWPACAAFLYALSRLTGSRPDFSSLLALCAWATLPLTVRSAVQAVYMLGSGRLLEQPGLAGLLAGASAGEWATQVGRLTLGWIDLFWLWHLGLLALAVHVEARLSMTKASVVISLYSVLILMFANAIVLG